MALSDEDYGILLNAIYDKHEYSDTRPNLIGIERYYKVEGVDAPWALCSAPLQHLEDFAAFIILSEGRELP